jgi:cob(I)alamin adenosyltransferase
MKIYTRTGDDGETSFLDGGRVPKSALRVDTYGEVDELNSSLGVAITNATQDEVRSTLSTIQSDLFSVGAILADPKGQLSNDKVALDDSAVKQLEELIDRIVSQLEPLKTFILPGGSMGGASLHHARSVCRRAERKIVELASNEPVPSVVMSYMNRLSDLLFVLARLENKHQGIVEETW